MLAGKGNCVIDLHSALYAVYGNNYLESYSGAGWFCCSDVKADSANTFPAAVAERTGSSLLVS